MGVGSLTGYILEAIDEPPFSLAFVMVKESFVVPTILFYLASDATKNKRPDRLNKYWGVTFLLQCTFQRSNGHLSQNTIGSYICKS